MGFSGQWYEPARLLRALRAPLPWVLLLSCGGEANDSGHPSKSSHSGGLSSSSSGSSTGSATGGVTVTVSGGNETGGTGTIVVGGSGPGVPPSGGGQMPPTNGGGTQVTRACTDAKPTEFGGGFVACQEGSLHRPEVSDCQPPAPPREPSPGVCHASDECCANADCSAPHSYCSDAHYCTPGCGSDSDCPSGSLCLCNELVGLCVPASCHSDADCPASLPCSAGDSLLGGFACQDPNDQCLLDGDCPGAERCLPGGPFARARSCVSRVQ